MVRVGDDGTSLVVAPAGTPDGGSPAERGPAEYRLPVDERLRALVRGTPSQGTLPIRTRSRLTPREIQARLRAGATSEQVAKAAGVTPEWVARFEGPILGERAQVVVNLQEAAVPAARGDAAAGRAVHRIGPVVTRNLAALGAKDVVWDSRLDRDGTWTVHVSWTGRPARPARGGPRPAEVEGEAGEEPHRRYARWAWDSLRRAVRPLDRSADALCGRPVPPRAGGTPAVPSLIAGSDDLALLRVVQEASGSPTVVVPPPDDLDDLTVEEEARLRAARRVDTADPMAVLWSVTSPLPREAAGATAAEEPPSSPPAARDTAEPDAAAPADEPEPGPDRSAEDSTAAEVGTVAGAGADAEVEVGPEAEAEAEVEVEVEVEAGTEPEVDVEPTPEPAPRPAVPTERPTPPGRGNRRPSTTERRAGVPAWDDILFGARRPGPPT